MLCERCQGECVIDGSNCEGCDGYGEICSHCREPVGYCKCEQGVRAGERDPPEPESTGDVSAVPLRRGIRVRKGE